MVTMLAIDFLLIWLVYSTNFTGKFTEDEALAI